MNKLMLLVLKDIVQNKIVIVFTILLLLLSWSIFMLEDSPGKGFLTLLNVVLLVVPLMALLFSTIYIYNSVEFIELLVSQPIKRKTIWLSLYLGLAISLSTAFLVSAGLPLLLFCELKSALMLLGSGILVTLIFVSIAFLATISSRDKAKGIGLAILLWLYFALLFDGLVLFLLFQFADYPIERPMVILSLLSPIDIARISNLLQMDASAMLGYTGAIFKQNFGSGLGLVITGLAMFTWVVVPFLISMKKFNKKDL